MKAFFYSLPILGAISIASCSKWTDYDSKDFDNVNDAAKAFESLSDDEIQAIVDKLAATKLPAMSTAAAREAFTAVIAAFNPKSLFEGGFGLAGAGGDPCQGENDTSVKNTLDCQTDRSKFYVKEARQILGKVNETLSDVNKALVFMLSDDLNAIKCGTPVTDIKAPSKIRSLLPKKWQDAVMDYVLPNAGASNGVACLSQLALSPKQSYHLIVRRPLTEGAALTPSAYLAINPSKDSTHEANEFPAAYKTDTFARYFLSISGEDGKISNRSDKTIGNVSLAYKDKNNFYSRIVMTNRTCRPDYVAIPEQVVIEVEVVNGVWGLNTSGYSPRFSAPNCATEDTQYAANFYATSIANDQIILSKFHAYPQATTAAGFAHSDTFYAGNFCKNFPGQCDANGNILPGATNTTANKNITCKVMNGNLWDWIGYVTSCNYNGTTLDLSNLSGHTGLATPIAPFTLQTALKTKVIPATLPSVP